MREEKIKKAVREGYGRIAAQGGSCCLPTVSCCGTGPSAETISRQVGYSLEALQAVPEGANLGLGLSGQSRPL